MAKKNRKPPAEPQGPARVYKTGTETHVVSVLDCGLEEAAREVMESLWQGEARALVKAVFVDWRGNTLDAYLVTDLVLPVETVEDGPGPGGGEKQ
jgi:hypothetical protein